jgi:hypothetical protein
VPLLVDLANNCKDDEALEVNLIAALTAVAQGGEAGAQFLVNAQGGSLACCCCAYCSPSGLE